MNKLRVDFSRGASRLAVAGILLLVFACGAWSQTVYSSPVRITNTEAAPVYVTPAGGKMSVQVGNTVNVTAPSALPVSQQGTVTVGGTVAISGTPTVTLSGTPQVALSTTGNTVNLGGTFIVRSWDYNFPSAYTVSIPMGNFVNAVEAEMVTFHCYSNAGAKCYKAIIWMDSHAGDQPRFPFVTIAETVGNATTTYWNAALPGKLYIPAGADLNFYLDFQQPATGQCFVGLSGRKH